MHLADIVLQSNLKYSDCIHFIDPYGKPTLVLLAYSYQLSHTGQLFYMKKNPCGYVAYKVMSVWMCCLLLSYFSRLPPGDYNEELSQALKAQSALSEQTDLSVPPFERTDQSDERLTPTKVRRLGSVSAIIV